MLFQKIWTANIEWDEIIPEEWKIIREDIKNINNIKIPRWIGFQPRSKVELHGFCDASQKSYSGVVYARIITGEHISVVLVSAKTRLVPISKKVTIPRLELCGALLLAQLMNKIITCMGNNEFKIYC